jgi:hypothetical protein
MLRVMHHPRPRYARAGIVTSATLLAFALGSVVACSDDKPAHSGQAQQSAGGESSFDRAKRNVDQAHENFKQEIRPAAGWVDEKSHRVADEVGSAVGKGKRKLDGDADHEPDDSHDHDHDGDHDSK